MAVKRPDWVAYGTGSTEVAFAPSALGEAVVKQEVRRYGHLTGLSVQVILAVPDAEGGGADKPHPVWTFLMEGVR